MFQPRLRLYYGTMKRSFTNSTEADKKMTPQTTGQQQTDSTSRSEDFHQACTRIAMELNLDPEEEEVQRLAAISLSARRKGPVTEPVEEM